LSDGHTDNTGQGHYLLSEIALRLFEARLHRQAWAMLTRLAARAGRTGREGDEEQGGQDAKTSIVRRS
jgi:hypothetical protein